MFFCSLARDPCQPPDLLQRYREAPIYQHKGTTGCTSTIFLDEKIACTTPSTLAHVQQRSVFTPFSPGVFGLPVEKSRQVTTTAPPFVPRRPWDESARQEDGPGPQEPLFASKTGRRRPDQGGKHLQQTGRGSDDSFTFVYMV